jgi:glycosidase
VEAQGYIYPSTYVKAHFLENHDLPRIHKLVPNILMLKHLTAWSFFQNGIGFLFAGQETLEKNLPSLFDKDTISLSIQHQEFYQFIKTLVQLKKRVEFSKTRKFLVNEHPLQAHLIEATIHSEAGSIHGIFNLSKDKRDVYVQLSDGMYFDLISQKNIEVAKGILTIEEPLMLKLPS